MSKSMGLQIKALLLFCLWFALGAVPVSAQVFHFQSDRKSTADGAALCLAVDTKKPLVPPPNTMVTPPENGTPYPLTDRFYPVIVQSCDTLSDATPAAWQATDTRELRVTIDKKAMCLSARNLTSFTPLLDPFLAAFQANQPESSFAYLAKDLKPNGAVNDKRLAENPDFVVGPCGRADASDMWIYDDLSGTISGPNMGGRRQCVAIHGDGSKPIRYESGMPVNAANCGDVRTFKRVDNPLHIRWLTTTGSESLPHFPVLPEPGYFSGDDGIPIAGPLGRCLTADLPDKHIVTSQCDGRLEQNWKRIGAAIHLGASDECVERQKDSTLKMAACTGKPEQQWHYVVAQPEPNPGWRKTDVFGQFLAVDMPSKCWAVQDDSFIDPQRQRNPVRLANCASEQPRKTSWFSTDLVRTVRVSVIRFSDDDGSNPSMKTAKDDEVKAKAESMVSFVSDYYRVIGLRFVFDPAHDLISMKSTAANQMMGVEGDQVIHKTAGNEGYGKVGFAVMLKMGGGSSCSLEADYDRATVISNPLDGRPRDPADVLFEYPPDASGLPSYSRVVNESRISDSLGNIGHEAHELGHFFGLGHTFIGGGFIDIPPDPGDGVPWHQQNSEYCGNLRSASINGAHYTPDRTNNESYWGCMTSRDHTALTPQQLGRMASVMNQLDRYPILACQPLHIYDANHVECENAESLARCQETAAYLKAKNATELVCQLGGNVSRNIAALLSMPAISFVLQNTPEGIALMNKIGDGRPGGQLSLPMLAKTIDVLQSCKNLPLTMAMANRFKQLRDLAVKQSPALAAGFAPNGAPIGGKDQQLLGSLTKQVFSQVFIGNVPVIVR